MEWKEWEEEWLRRYRPWVFEEIDPAVRVLLKMIGVSEEEFLKRRREHAGIDEDETQRTGTQVLAERVGDVGVDDDVGTARD